MTSNSDLAIAILNWNGKKWLETFLPFVVEHSKGAQIYVIDNDSTDDSLAFLKENYPQIGLVVNSINHGFAGGYNEGLSKIKARFYCLLNSDVEVCSNWLDAPLELFHSRPDVAAIQPKILSYAARDTFEFAGAGGGLIDNLGYPYCRGRKFETLEKDHGQYDDECEIFWASGACLFIRSKDFWAQGGFDPRFFAHQEEIDLCWRLRNAGRKIYYTGLSKVYHVGGGTLNKQSPQKTFLNFRNNLTMLLKNLPFPSLIGLIFFRLCLDGIAGLRFGFKEGFPHLWAVARAHFGFYAQAKQTWRSRGPHQIKRFYQSKWLIFKHFL